MLEFSHIYHFIRKSKKTIRVDQKLPTRCSLIDETMKVVKNSALPEVDSTSFPGFSPTRPTERERVPLRRAGRREPWERGWSGFWAPSGHNKFSRFFKERTRYSKKLTIDCFYSLRVINEQRMSESNIALGKVTWGSILGSRSLLNDRQSSRTVVSTH